MVEPVNWCIIVNLNTCSQAEWKHWQAILEKNEIPYVAHFSSSLSSLSTILDACLKNGHQYFLFAGGDGTVHQGGNLLIQLAANKAVGITMGVLPCGTGNDWVRTFGIKTVDLPSKLKSPVSEPMNLVRITWPDGREKYAFNMVGGALDAAVVDSLLKSKWKIPGRVKYPIALVMTLMKPHKWKGTVIVDGRSFTDDWLTIQAGYGKYCGGGMYVLPHAGSGQAAILLMKTKSILRLISSLSKLYSGKIANQKEAIALHFSEIKIDHDNIPIPIEAEGEFLGYSPVKLSCVSGLLNRLA